MAFIRGNEHTKNSPHVTTLLVIHTDCTVQMHFLQILTGDSGTGDNTYS